MTDTHQDLQNKLNLANKQRGEQGNTIHTLRMEVEYLRTLKDKDEVRGHTNVTINIDPNSDDILKTYGVKELDVLHNYIGIGTYWLNSIRRKDLVEKEEAKNKPKFEEYPTGIQIDAAIKVLRKYMSMPYLARVADYIHEGAQGMAFADGLAKLQDADREAEQRNRHIVGKALKAAMDLMDK